MGPVTATMVASAQTPTAATIDRSEWKINQNDTVQDLACQEPATADCFSLAAVPASDDAKWETAPDRDTIGFDGKVKPGYGGPSASHLDGSQCHAAVNYTYYETTITVPEGVDPKTFTVDFFNIDDAAQISIINDKQPNGGPKDLVLADSSGTKTANLADQLAPGKNRVVITQLDLCAPGNTLEKAEITLDGEKVEVVPPDSDVDTTDTVSTDSVPVDTTDTVATDTVDTADTVATDDTEVPPTVPKDVPPAPNAHGDVHNRTPDGLVYDFQEFGDFVFSKSGTDLEVQARLEPYGKNPNVSVITSITLISNGDKLEFYVRPDAKYFVNGAETPVPTDLVTLPGGATIQPTDPGSTNDFTIEAADGKTGLRVIQQVVEPDGSYMDYGIARREGTQEYEGIIGNLNGDPDDDLTLKDGTKITPPASLEQLHQFGDSWRVPASEPTFTVPPASAPPSAVPTTVQISDTKIEDAKKTCEASGIDDQLSLDNCAYDVAATGSDSFVKSAKTFETSVEKLPEAQQDNVAALDAKDQVIPLSEESSDSFLSNPAVLIGIGLLVILIVIGIVLMKRRSDAATAGGPPPGQGPRTPQGPQTPQV